MELAGLKQRIPPRNRQPIGTPEICLEPEDGKGIEESQYGPGKSLGMFKAQERNQGLRQTSQQHWADECARHSTREIKVIITIG